MAMQKLSCLNPKSQSYNLLFRKKTQVKQIIFLIKSKSKSSLGKSLRKEDGIPTKIKGNPHKFL